MQPPSQPIVKSKGGRPTVRTAEKAKQVAEALARGLPIAQTCAIVGISYPSLCKWRKADPEFEQEIQQALARGVDARLTIIEEAAKKDWRAAAWLLERTLPESFGKQRTTESVSLVQNNTLIIPRELLDQLAESRRTNEKAIQEG
jgi:hypothetical protein